MKDEAPGCTSKLISDSPDISSHILDCAFAQQSHGDESANGAQKCAHRNKDPSAYPEKRAANESWRRKQEVCPIRNCNQGRANRARTQHLKDGQAPHRPAALSECQYDRKT